MTYRQARKISVMLQSHASSADERMPRMSSVVKVKESMSFKWPRRKAKGQEAIQRQRRVNRR